MTHTRMAAFVLLAAATLSVGWQHARPESREGVQAPRVDSTGFERVRWGDTAVPVPDGWQRVVDERTHAVWAAADRRQTLTVAVVPRATGSTLEAVVGGAADQMPELLPGVRVTAVSARMGREGEIGAIAFELVGAGTAGRIRGRQLWLRTADSGPDLVTTWTAADGLSLHRRAAAPWWARPAGRRPSIAAAGGG